MAKPFLKWVGGKSRFTTQLQACAPAQRKRLVEPFMGSAALFFAAEPAKALLADLNEDVVTCFKGVAQDYAAVIDRLDAMPNTKEFFLEVREQDPASLSKLDRAARTIYLNKTSFRGLWRVNKKGKFNAPYGAYDRPLYNRETLGRAAALLQHAELHHQSFEDTLIMTRPGDWVFLDPPYVPAGGYADFKRYTSAQFHEADHRKLVSACHKLSNRGVKFLLTNTNNQISRELYGDFELYAMKTKRDIALNADSRASSDLVVSNYELPPEAPVMRIDIAGQAVSLGGSRAYPGIMA